MKSFACTIYTACSTRGRLSLDWIQHIKSRICVIIESVSTSRRTVDFICFASVLQLQRNLLARNTESMRNSRHRAYVYSMHSGYRVRLTKDCVSFYIDSTVYSIMHTYAKGSMMLSVLLPPVFVWLKSRKLVIIKCVWDICMCCCVLACI